MRDDIGLIIKKIHDSLEKHANHVLKPYDLTLSQVLVLDYLQQHSYKRVTQKELYDYMEVAQPTMVGILKRLEKKEMINTSIHVDETLVKTAVLTVKGKKTVQKLDNMRQQMEQTLLEGISDDQKKELILLLTKIQSNTQAII